MTPDERAARAERVIVESIDQLRALAAWCATSDRHAGELLTETFTYVADEIARNARIAGIEVGPLTLNGRGGASSGSS